VAGSRKLCGMRACIAWMSEGVPVAAVEAMDAANCSSATSRPYRGAWRCRPASPAAKTKQNISLMGHTHASGLQSRPTTTQVGYKE
jgi:hypothetical protein